MASNHGCRVRILSGLLKTFYLMARYANGIAAKLKPWCLWVRIPPVLLTIRVGMHWRAKLAVNQRSSDCGGSTPSRPTYGEVMVPGSHDGSWICRRAVTASSVVRVLRVGAVR